MAIILLPFLDLIKARIISVDPGVIQRIITDSH